MELQEETAGQPQRPPSVDQRVFLHDVSWSQYEAVLVMRGEGSGVRIAYREGELELMSPSRDHEVIKTELARLLEAYAEERGVDLNGYGSWTVKNALLKRGVEPDECYVVGPGKEVPDIAIEVIWTSGGMDKLDLYRHFGVREVWIWRDGRLQVRALGADGYVSVARSELLPDLDLELLVRFVGGPSQTQSVRDFRRALRGG